MTRTRPFQTILETSERVAWRLDDVLPPEAGFDFTRPFLPDGLARVAGLDFLDEPARLVLNQIRGHGYLALFGIVEEFILPFVLDHARGDLGGDDFRTRALLGFAAEEAKHIQLFKRFRDTYERGTGLRPGVVGPPDAIARAVLGHGALGVALAILHIEWMTQRHYVDSVKGDDALEPRFKSLLHHHWLEEAQHARLDGLVALELAARLAPDELDRGIDDYLAICRALDGLLRAQVELDLASLRVAAGAPRSAADTARLRDAQLAALRWTFIGSGITHPSFLAVVDRISPDGAARVRAAANLYRQERPMSQSQTAPANVILNGFDTQVMAADVEAIAADASRAPVTFRASTVWTGGASSRTEVESYDLGGQTILRRHTIRTDEPTELWGGNSAPNPQDLLLAALGSCMMFGFVAGCTKRGIVVHAVAIDTELALDLRGPLGLDPAIKPGAESIRYTIRVSGTGTPEQLAEVHEEMKALSPNRFHVSQPIRLESRLVVA
jgi:uncharacterized OsmC-like protein